MPTQLIYKYLLIIIKQKKHKYNRDAVLKKYFGHIYVPRNIIYYYPYQHRRHYIANFTSLTP